MSGIYGGLGGGGGGSSTPVTMSVFAQSAAPSSLTGTTSSTSLIQIPVPAYTLGSFGQFVIDIQLSWTNNSNNKTFTIQFGGLSVLSTTQSGNVGMRVNEIIANRGVLNQQSAWPSINSYALTGASPPSLNVDTSQAQTLAFIVQLGNSADTIRIENYSVRLLNP